MPDFLRHSVPGQHPNTPDLSRISSRIALLAAFLAIAGCGVFPGFDDSTVDGQTERLPIEQRPRLAPGSRNFFLLASPDQSVIGEPQLVFARAEDTFSDLAREYGLGYDELVAANPGVDPWLPGGGTPVLLPTQYVLPDTAREGVILNIASKRLFYYPATAEDQPVQVLTFPIGIGRVGWETPLGSTSVVSKARDPHWYVPASVRREHAEAGNPISSVVPPGPENPLGRFVLKLEMPGYLIHGTNQPYGVGMRVSHGCVRLYPENIELLYSLVAIGEAVTILNEPFLAGWRNGELYFEAHAPLEEDALSPDEHLQDIFDAVRTQSGAFTEQHEQDQARTLASDALGVPVRVLLGDVAEMYERARLVRNTVETDPEAPTLAEVREILDAPDEAGDESGTPAVAAAGEEGTSQPDGE